MEWAKEQQYQQRIAELERENAQLKAEAAQLRTEAAQLRAEVAQLKDLVAQLQRELARLRSNSSTSSKPPSSDLVKPPRPPGKARRGIGGQVGHPRHQRPPFAPGQIDRVVDHTLRTCPRCGHAVRPLEAGPIRILQQVEIPLQPARVTEHRVGEVVCPHCRRAYHSSLPPEVRQAGLIGPRLRALIGYLKGVGHASFSTIRKFLRDVLGVEVSRGRLARVLAETSEAMAEAYGQLEAALPGAPRLNVDETGHKDNGRPHWTWCFVAELYTLFRIDPSRGSGVLVRMLGEEFEGVLGCDYFSAYRKYMGDFDVRVQFCLAHLIRDVKFLTTLPDRVTANYGRRVLEGLRGLFRVIHRREAMEPARFQRALETARDALVAVGRRAPQRTEARNLAERFGKHGAAYFQFITTPGIEPTNNLAEQAIRFVVIDRLVTQGTRSETGRRWCERIWSAIASCAQQGRSVFEYLVATVSAGFAGQPPPSLLPTAG